MYLSIYYQKLSSFMLLVTTPKLYSGSREPEEKKSYLLLIYFLSRGDISLNLFNILSISSLLFLFVLSILSNSFFKFA